MTSVPGVNIINGAQILARLGDPARFRSLAGARSFSGLVPSLSASGVNDRHGPPTKSGDAPLREALFMAANNARAAACSVSVVAHTASAPRPGSSAVQCRRCSMAAAAWWAACR